MSLHRQTWGECTSRAMVLYEKGWSIKDIAAALGRPYKSTKMKIEYERSRGERPKRRGFTDEEFQRMVELRESGMTYLDIGKQFGANKHQISDTFRRRKVCIQLYSKKPRKSATHGDYGAYIKKLPQVPDHIVRKFAKDEPLTDAEFAEYQAAIQSVDKRYIELLQAGEITPKVQR